MRKFQEAEMQVSAKKMMKGSLSLGYPEGSGRQACYRLEGTWEKLPAPVVELAGEMSE